LQGDAYVALATANPARDPHPPLRDGSRLQSRHERHRRRTDHARDDADDRGGVRALGRGPQGRRWVDGEVIFKKSVSGDHDEIRSLIAATLDTLIKRQRLGKLRGPSFTIRMELPGRVARGDPDVMFVSNEALARHTPNALHGPADLVVEVVSPDSQFRDFNDKFNEYQAAGVREYWIVSPLGETIDVFALNPAGKFDRKLPDPHGRHHSAVVPGFWLHGSFLFTPDRPSALGVLARIDADDANFPLPQD
jgi:Uma2 family endonuclease